MKTTAEYLDEIKSKTGIESDYGVAMKLGLSRFAVSNYRHCKNAFDNHTCLIVARTLGTPLEQVIADMELQREKDEKKKADWLSFELRLKGAAASILAMSSVALVTMIVTPSPANAVETRGYSENLKQIQIMRTRKARKSNLVAVAWNTLNIYFRLLCCPNWTNSGKRA